MGKKHRTADKEAPEVLTTHKLGRTQALTPEGFLLCTDVPIARIGTMIYGPGETPIKAGSVGVAYVTRDAAELFSDETVASFQGKAITDNHPPVDVDPSNWRRYSKGITLNPRRGTGDEADYLVADLLITDQSMIEAVRGGKREVSAGYDAEYQQTGEGEGKQTGIIGNHVALVTRARCGPRCSIGDHQPNSPQEEVMPTKQTRTRVPLQERVRAIFKDAGDTLAEELGDELDSGSGGESGVHLHIHGGPTDMTGDPARNPVPGQDDAGSGGGDPIEARFQSLEQGHQQIMESLQTLAETVAALANGGQPATGDDGAPPSGSSTPSASETPPGGNDGGEKQGEDGEVDDLADGEGSTDPTKAKTGDSAALATTFQAVLADAEVLVPGFRMPTFDAALPRAKTVDSMCALRRNVLKQFDSTYNGHQMLSQLGGVDIESGSCSDVAAAFKAAALLKRAGTNRALTGDASKAPVPATSGPRTMTVAEINAKNAEFWAARGGI